jgi:predicted phosphodiesterase
MADIRLRRIAKLPESVQTGGMETKGSDPTSALWYCAPLLAAAALILFLALSASARGLLAWNSRYLGVLVAIAALGALPAIALFAHSQWTRGRNGRGVKIGKIALRAFSALASAGLAAGLACIAVLGSTPFSATLSAQTKLNFLSAAQTDAWAQPGRALRFAFSSDAHIGSPFADPKATDEIVARVDSGGYDAFFVLGDVVEMGIIDAQLRAASAAFAKASTVPLSFVMGNHDALIAAAPRFQKAFGIPSRSFRIDSGSLHVIALDLLWGTEDWSAEKSRRLAAELDAIPARDAVIVMSHCFFYASGYVDPGTGKDWFDHAQTIKEIAPILESHGVDLVVTGHNHYLEYLEHGGTAYLLVGGLGGKPDPQPTHVSPASRWFSRAVYGFAEAQLGGDTLGIRFIDKDGKILFETQRPINQ